MLVRAWEIVRGKEKYRRELHPRPTDFSDRPLLYRVSYESRREQVVGDCGSNCGNVNVKGTNEFCSASTKDTNDGSEN